MKIATKVAPTVGRLLAVVAVPAALFVTPQAVLAQNECGVQVGTTPVDCNASSYASGVTYDAVGDLFIDFTNTPTTTVGGNGVTLAGDGTESITFDSQSTNTELQSSGVVGALLDVTTVNGDIGIDAEEMDADISASGVTHAIYAESTGTGNIDINITGNVDAQGGNPSDSIGIEAIANGGDIAITTAGFTTGNQYGIRAVAAGAGTLDITTLGSVNSSGEFGIDATTDTGLLSLDINGSVVGGARADAGGDIQINVGSGGTTSDGDGTAMDLTAAGDIVLFNDGRIIGNDFAVLATANSLVLTNNNEIEGALGFADLGGNYVFNNNDLWQVTSDSPSDLSDGVINNAGTIDFEGRGRTVQAPGATFNGLTGSTLDMPMELSGAGQSDCQAPVVASCLDLSGATTTGQTSILITTVAPPLDPSAGLTGEANPGILLVDVGGGSSGAGHFVVGQGSENYAESSLYGGVVTTGGPLVYTMLYNPDTQQHFLSSVPSREGITYVAFNQEVLSMWHTTADAVAGRQADLREGAARGGWIRAVSNRDERESRPTVTTHGNTFTYEQNYTLDTSAVMIGMDVHGGDNHVIGLHSGLVRSHLDFDDSTNRDRTKGAAVGVYGGWWRDMGAGQLTLDGTLNANFLRLKHENDIEVTDSDVRSLGAQVEAGWLLPMGEMFYVQPLATAAYVRADIETITLRQNDLRFEETNSERAALGVRLGGNVDLSGNRFGHLKYWLTARAWEEYAEDGSADFQTTGEPLSIEDDISESFEEVGLGVNLAVNDKLSMFLSGNLRSGDDTDSSNVTIGARLNW